MNLIQKKKAEKNVQAMIETNNQIIGFLEMLLDQQEEKDYSEQEIEALELSIKHLDNMTYVFNQMKSK